MVWSIVPENVAITSLVSLTVSLLRVAVKPASQNWPRHRRGCWRSGKTSHFRAARGSWGKGSRAVCVATMVYPLYIRTRFSPWTTETLLSHGKVAGRKWLVQPESATANYIGRVTSVYLKLFLKELLRLCTTSLPLLCHFFASAPPCMYCLVAV